MNLDELDTTQTPNDLRDGVSPSKPATQETETVPSVEKSQEFKEPLPITEQPSAGPSYSNPAFVPEMEVSAAEETPPPQTDDTLETSNEDSTTLESTDKQQHDVCANEGGSVAPPLVSEATSEPTDAKEVRRTDFV